MERQYKFVVLLMFCCALVGCSTISKKDCVRGDWQTIGYKDGKRGYETDRLESHAKTCAKVDVLPNEAEYRAGYAEGIQVYCTPENGSRVGRNDDDYRGVCPGNLEYGFLENYVTALKIKRDDLIIQRDTVKDELEHARDARSRIPAGLEVPRRLRKEIEHLESRLSGINSERRSVNNKIAKWSVKL